MQTDPGNTGIELNPVTGFVPDTLDAAAVADKVQTLADNRPKVAELLVLGLTAAPGSSAPSPRCPSSAQGAMTPACSGGNPPWTASVTQRLDIQHYTNSCLPNSSKWVLDSLGVNVSEGQMVNEEHTGYDAAGNYRGGDYGTWPGYAASVLNRHIDRSRYYYLDEHPDGPDSYMNYVVSDIYSYHQPLLNYMAPNPDGGTTPFLPRWSGNQGLKHTTITYAYDTHNGGWVFIADDMDFSYGSYQAPYGNSRVELAKVYGAIQAFESGPWITW